MQGNVWLIPVLMPVLALLLLWEDRNHNGISEPEELQPATNIVSDVGLSYQEHNRRDGHGNLFKYRGWAHEIRFASEVFARIGLGWTHRTRRDKHGNVFRFEGWVRLRDAPGLNGPGRGEDIRQRSRPMFEVVFVR